MICEYKDGACVHCGFKPPSMPYFKNCVTLLAGRSPSDIELPRPFPISTSNGGPGTELKRLLSLVGITATEDCACNRNAAQMDAWGPDECELRIDEIVGWLEKEASSRGLPFVKVAATMMVKRAIAASRKKLKAEAKKQP